MSTTSIPAPGPAEIWSTGDYPQVCDRMIPDMGARLVELAGVRSDSTVLDVAAGTGNASLPAAHIGASVTALDITPELVAVGEQRSNEAGLQVDWVCGDAQALPCADASFDHVLSCVGVQFCPGGQAAAAELCRVCKQDGVIALASWTPEGFIGRVLSAIAAARGGDVRGLGPLDWGREERVAEMLRRPVSDLTLSREHVLMPAESAEEWVDFMADAYGPMARARIALEARHAWRSLREELIEVAEAHRAPNAGGFAVRAEYLTVALER